MEKILQSVDILKINEEEMLFFAETRDEEEAAKYFHSKGIPYILITLGKQGCYYSFNGKRTAFSGYLSALNVKAIDTTGAGDAFIGSFLANLLDVLPPKQFKKS